MSQSIPSLSSRPHPSSNAVRIDYFGERGSTRAGCKRWAGREWAGPAGDDVDGRQSVRVWNLSSMTRRRRHQRRGTAADHQLRESRLSPSPSACLAPHWWWNYYSPPFQSINQSVYQKNYSSNVRPASTPSGLTVRIKLELTWLKT